ncbi:MAG: FecR domain-containing protein [Bacteroidales bacterium]|nr:FecR domain-containing protein [Bacteroidales bacterium]
MKIKETYWKDIAASISGEMSADEELAFMAQTKENEQLRNDHKLMRRTLNEFNTGHLEKYRDTKTAWKKLNHRLKKDGLLEEDSTVIYLHRMPHLLRIAALALLIMAVGVPSVYYALDKMGQNNKNEYRAAEASRTVDLPDGSRVYLNAGATLKHEKSFDHEREVLLEGEGYFEVKPDPEHPFRVSSRNVTVTVLGTSFNVRETGTSTVEVFVESGKVLVGLKEEGASLTLEAGQYLRANGSLEIAALDDPNYLSWKTRQFKFVDQPLEQIIDVLERAYHVEVNTKNIADDSMRLTTTYNNQSIDDILATICTALNMNFEKEGKVYILQSN